ncbi:hypothetical protein [Neoroseomonas oryzicola]|uniref:Uncharacterized protein n=1 Tax=Neoroseomonas oryzicola TaxID=535904 RepID=A0A9X9WIQ0_9PROT|nr:hypothetical protein [Neoroseomonas oryzicola]MBR0660210.1 hypothetical protein [Neoroseomonas oryzicola]NKE16715.1 hypothetical protein [Neoroseomonas oryzicola]
MSDQATPSIPETTAEKRPGRTARGQFAAGNAGRPRGSRHVVLKMLDTIGEENAQAVWQKALDLAKGGDTTALRLVLERVMPARRMNPVKIDLPKIESTGDVVDAMLVVTTAVASGQITPDEGQAVTEILEGARRAIETHQLRQKLLTLNMTIDQLVGAPRVIEGGEG